MLERIALVSLSVVALAVAGCGSSSKKSKTTATPATSSPSTTSKGSSAGAVKPKTYRVKLAGTNEVPSGAPKASGLAVISIRAKTNQLCWKFTNLKQVTKPLLAHIHQGAAGVAGNIVIPLGTAYKASGCVPQAQASLLAQIEAKPKGFYVNVHNAKYPGGVVRAQL